MFRLKRWTTALLSGLVCMQIYAQTAGDNAGFKRIFVSEFDSRDATVWKTQTQKTYSLSIQDGRYVVESEEKSLADLVLPEADSVGGVWTINTALSISSKGGAAGVVFNVKDRLKEYYFVEFNGDRQYRCGWKSADNAIRYFTGTDKNSGWNTEKKLPKRKSNIAVSIAQKEELIEVYAAGIKLYHFSPGANRSGYFGLMFSGAIEAQFDSMAVWQKPRKEPAADNMPSDVVTLTRALLDARISIR